MKSVEPRISDWTWPPPSPERKNQTKRAQMPTPTSATSGGGRREHAQRLVERVDAEDREAVAADVRPHRREQPRGARLLVGAHRDVLDGHEHLAGLDQRLERVGELGDHLELERGLAVVGAEAGGGVRHAGAGRAPHDRAAEALQPLLERGEVLDACPSGGRRSPCRPLPATIGSTSRPTSPPWYWLSASVLTITSAPSFSEASSPAWKAAASPRLLVSRTMWSTPCSRATSMVRSVEPSSITSHSTESIPSTDRGRSARVPGRVRSSLKQGIWMMSFIGCR